MIEKRIKSFNSLLYVKCYVYEDTAKKLFDRKIVELKYEVILIKFMI